MFREFRKFSLGLTLVISILLNSGCVALLAGAAVGAGGVAWVKGVLEKNVDASLDKTYKATKRGLKQLKLPVVDEEKETELIRIKSTYSDGRNVNIDLKAVTGRATTIRIRVGAFGDKSASESILTATLRNL